MWLYKIIQNNWCVSKTQQTAGCPKNVKRTRQALKNCVGIVVSFLSRWPLCHTSHETDTRFARRHTNLSPDVCSPHEVPLSTPPQPLVIKRCLHRKTTLYTTVDSWLSFSLSLSRYRTWYELDTTRLSLALPPPRIYPHGRPHSPKSRFLTFSRVRARLSLSHSPSIQKIYPLFFVVVVAETNLNPIDISLLSIPPPWLQAAWCVYALRGCLFSHKYIQQIIKLIIMTSSAVHKLLYWLITNEFCIVNIIAQCVIMIISLSYIFISWFKMLLYVCKTTL